MRSNRAWQQWVAYARAIGYRVVEDPAGYSLRIRYPCGTTAATHFGTRRECMRALRKFAVHDLREDEALRRNARYAACTGDTSIFNGASAVGGAEPSTAAKVARAAHRTLAKRTFPLRAHPDLERAARLHAVLDEMPEDAVQAHYLAEARALHSAEQLEAQLTGTRPTERARSRL